MAEFASKIDPRTLGSQVVKNTEEYVTWAQNTGWETSRIEEGMVDHAEHRYHQMAWLLFVKNTVSKRYIPKKIAVFADSGVSLHRELAEHYINKSREQPIEPPAKVLDALVLGPLWYTVVEVAENLPLNKDQLAIALARRPVDAPGIIQSQQLMADPISITQKGRIIIGKGDYSFIERARQKAKTLGDSWKDVLYNQPGLPVIACDLAQKPNLKSGD